MTISINGQLVHRVDLLHVPYAGSWTLELAYPGDVAPSGKVTVQWGSVSFVGTVDPDHVGAFNGEVRAKIVGGHGWSTELAADWYQSDSPGIRGRTIATTAAQAVGETLYGATGQTQPSENLFRPLRVSYSRGKQTAAMVLRDVLAQGVASWTDFDGATRVGFRMAPLPARVALLDYDAGSKWADLECNDPANLIGATIPADTVRGTPALVINELFAWTDNKGFRYRAAVAPIATPESSRLVESLRALVRGLIPELPALELRRARIVAQSSDGRVSLQQVERDGTVSDFGSAQGAVRLYAGTPGTSADLDIVATETRPGFAPETILAFTSADQSSPVTFLAAPLGQPGHVPLVVRHEAWNGIRFVGASSGKVFVGESPTYPVLLAPTVLTYLARIEDAFLAIDSFLTAAVGPYGALVTARKAAYTQMANGASAARLEAK